MRDGNELVGWGMATGIWEALQMPIAVRIVLSANGHAEVLGYDVKDRKLVVNEDEADRVRLIFRQYLAVEQRIEKATAVILARSAWARRAYAKLLPPAHAQKRPRCGKPSCKFLAILGTRLPHRVNAPGERRFRPRQMSVLS